MNAILKSPSPFILFKSTIGKGREKRKENRRGWGRGEIGKGKGESGGKEHCHVID